MRNADFGRRAYLSACLNWFQSRTFPAVKPGQAYTMNMISDPAAGQQAGTSMLKCIQQALGGGLRPISLAD
jgi:hypothetical protein